MEKREKTEERKQFTYEERIFIRKKSNGVCSHCGKKLKDDFTVEHVVPLSKGGTNDLSNIVALCETCNFEKDNLIYHPSDYYSYLLPEYLDELVKNQLRYYKEYDWLTPDSILPEDMRELKIPCVIKTTGIMAHRGKNGKINTPLYTSSVYLKKALYYNLDDIYNFCLKLMDYDKDDETYGVDDFHADIKSMITDWFENGAIYFLSDSKGAIEAIIPISFTPYNDDYAKSRTEANKGDGVVPIFESPIIKKSSPNFILALVKTYTYILANMVKRLNRPVYYIMETYQAQSAVSKASDLILFMSENVFGYDYYTDKNKLNRVLYNAKWVSSDDCLLDNAQTVESIEKYAKPEEDLIYIEKHDFLEHIQGKSDVFQLGISDLDAYKKDMRVFARNLARQLGYRQKIELIAPDNTNRAVTDEEVYEIIELPIDEVKLPIGVTNNISIPAFIKKQVKLNCVKHIEVDAFYTVLKTDAPVLVYLKQLGKKTVLCKMKKKYYSSLNSNISDFEIANIINSYPTEEERDFLKGIYTTQVNSDGSYAPIRIVLSQENHCEICECQFSDLNFPYTLFKVPKRVGGSSDESNMIAVCKKCKGFVGGLSYSEELKKLIQNEYVAIEEYERSKEVVINE
jgi:hypothetical protein